MATDASAATSSESRGTPLEATLLVDPPDCPLARKAPNAAAVSQTLSCAGDCRTCHSEVTVASRNANGKGNGNGNRTAGRGSGRKRIHTSADIGSDCVCPAISAFDCVFSLESIRDGSLVFTIVVRDRELITDIVAAIRETGGSVRLERITTDEAEAGAGAERDEPSVDAADITAKQREAIELAVELGYYDRPRRTDLQELADRLEISRSAVSQRLNAAESKLLRSFLSS
ncbi:DNA-binding protein [Halobiforma lacisalsi AJ5]|uniref:DNA-binding protein n=1 Tax=Natronobacterium lacisalsi AJ5 TaxID=358396 RepID=M0LHC6_NATLA|nr:helix-turn-helix domain-containing protein [Halobiforma lacisalsi]APW98619.1 DNA-binding protein [Halobiforma lacisalsi AJ5]EMA32483.1 DNA binding protein [Halobiforma lacisalsi AJ5]